MPGVGERWAGAEQPTIVDGVRGEGLPVISPFGMDKDFTGKRVKVLKGYSAAVPLVIKVPDRKRYTVDLLRWMTYDKFPLAGVPIPVSVERNDPTKVRIEWDEVPDVDELIRIGAPVFTDPDRVEADLRAAMTESVEAVAERTDEVADRLAQAMGTTLEPGQVRNVLHEMRGKLDGGSTRAPARIPSDQPSARVIAFTQQVGDGENAILQGNQQMILSVAIPGQPRYGYRWRGIIHTRRFFAEWTDLPIRVSRRGHVDIEWHEVDSVLDVAAQEVKRAGEQMEQRLADLQNGGPQRMMQQLIESVATDPAQRALLEQQVAEASSQPWANPLAPPPPPTSPPSGPATTDPAALLAQLADLRAAGALTDAEYATERQKILDQI